MDRRELMTWIGGFGATVAASAAGIKDQGSSGLTPDGNSTLVAQTAPPAHDHAAMMAARSAPSRYSALVVPYQECARASQACISHCQQLLAQGDKSLGTCLRTALDTEVVCSSVLKLANLNSQFTPALARQSIAVMQACVEACKEHVDHHAECKACHDACLKAIDAARALV
jgi:Cys-rich four helix bundle protein (predicted Tat secretion target)